MAKTAPAASTPIETLLKERRKFPPPRSFVKTAHANRAKVYAVSSPRVSSDSIGCARRRP